MIAVAERNKFKRVVAEVVTPTWLGNRLLVIIGLKMLKCMHTMLILSFLLKFLCARISSHLKVKSLN